MDIQTIAGQLEELTKKVNETEKASIKLLLNPEGVKPKYLKNLKNREKEDTKMYVFCGDVLPTTCGYTHDNKLWVAPSGNEFRLIEGEKVPSFPEMRIKKMYYSEDFEKYIIEVE